VGAQLVGCVPQGGVSGPLMLAPPCHQVGGSMSDI
jgi:hypothetical protein